MSGTAEYAKVVLVRVKEGKTGLFYATSPDLKGMLVAEPTMELLNAAIPQAIADLYLACGIEVIVTKVEERDQDSQLKPWVAVPTAVAAKAKAKTVPESRA